MGVTLLQVIRNNKYFSPRIITQGLTQNLPLHCFLYGSDVIIASWELNDFTISAAWRYKKLELHLQIYQL